MSNKLQDEYNKRTDSLNMSIFPPFNIGEQKELDKIDVLNEWLIVREQESEKEIKGILRPDTAEEVAVIGVVVGISKEGDSNIKMGDKVLYKKKVSFRRIEIDFEQFVALKKNETLAVIFGDGITDVSPLRDMVFLEWEFAAAFYGGTQILRPDNFKDMSHTGIVFAAGPDVKQVKVGDRVQFDQFSGVEKLQEGAKRYTIISEKTLYMVLPKRESAKEFEGEKVYESR